MASNNPLKDRRGVVQERIHPSALENLQRRNREGGPYTEDCMNALFTLTKCLEKSHIPYNLEQLTTMEYMIKEAKKKVNQSMNTTMAAKKGGKKKRKSKKSRRRHRRSLKRSKRTRRRR
jgi:hypothetical protein